MEAYVEGLEREFSAIERGFRAEESRARCWYLSGDPVEGPPQISHVIPRSVL